MKIILIELFHIFPGAAPEFALPVRGGHSGSLPLPENIEIFVGFIPCQGFLKPLVPAGGVIEHHIQHQPDAPGGCLAGQLLKIFHGAVPGIDPVIVLHIVSVILLRRYKEGRHPDIIHSQIPDIIQLLCNSSQITQSVSAAVIKGFGINLIYGAFSEVCH